MKKREVTKFNQLYNKFVQCLELQGYARVTVDTRLTKEDLKQYFADLLKTHSWSTIKLDRNALQHYWLRILNQEWDWVLIVKPPKVRQLPDILTPTEIQRVLAQVEKTRYAVLFYVLYTLGLRLGEGLNLKVGGYRWRAYASSYPVR